MPKAESSKPFPAFAIERLKGQLLSWPETTRSRGLEYATAGRVQPLEWLDADVRAKVRGSSIYTATWRWNGQAWNGACSCPVGRVCKHLYAVGHEILRARRDAGSAHDPRSLDELREASDPWRRARALSRLVLGPRPDLEPHVHRPPIAGYLDEPDFDLMCWHVARALAKLSGGWLPPALEPYRERPDLAERYRATLERGLLAELGEWASRAAPVESDRSVRILLRRIDGPPQGLALEVRLTSPRLADEPRTLRQVELLVSDARRNPGRLPVHQLALLEALLDAADSPYGSWDRAWPQDSAEAIVLDQADLWRLLAQAEARSAVAWHDDTPEAYGVTAGAPVRVDAEPLSIVPECEERAGRLVIDLFVRGASGRRVRLKDTLYVPSNPEVRETRSGLVVAQARSIA